MANRDKWEFEYTAKEVADAANAKATYHFEHADDWDKKATEMEQELRNRGISLSEVHHTGGVQFQAVMDQELARNYSNARNRKQFHEDKAEQYAEFSNALERHPEDRVMLTVQDISFFFGPPTKSQEGVF